jgi:hypothetical protein
VTSIPEFLTWTAPGFHKRSGAQKIHQPVKVWWVAVRRSDVERVLIQTSRPAEPAPGQSVVELNSEVHWAARAFPHQRWRENIGALSKDQD